MSRASRTGIQFVATDSPVIKRDSSVYDVASRSKEVLVAKSVVEEVRKRVFQLRGGESKLEREKQKEKDEKLEKARAAAWAWYQHGKGGKESVSSSSSSVGTASTVSGRSSSESGPKSSRFKTEALKTSDRNSSAISESGRSWDLSNVSIASGTSSLFDSYELDSVSKRIDTAFHVEGPPRSPPSAVKPVKGLPCIRPRVDSIHQQSEETTFPKWISGLPPPMRPPGATSSSPGASSANAVVAQQVTASSSPKVTRSSSLRMQFPRCICRSISDVVSQEEMAVGADIRKCDCQRVQVAARGSGSGWSFRRLSRAISDIMHLPECEYHPQQEHHERRHARLHLHHHQHHHHHDHEYHHHLHYQIKLRDGMYHGNSFTKSCPGKSNPLVEVPKEKDLLLFPRLSPKMSPKVSPKLF